MQDPQAVWKLQDLIWCQWDYCHSVVLTSFNTKIFLWCDGQKTWSVLDNTLHLYIPVPPLFHPYSVSVPSLFHSCSIPGPFQFHSSSIPVRFQNTSSSIPVPFQYHSSSIPVPYQFHSRSIPVLFLFHSCLAYIKQT